MAEEKKSKAAGKKAEEKEVKKTSAKKADAAEPKKTAKKTEKAKETKEKTEKTEKTAAKAEKETKKAPAAKKTTAKTSKKESSSEPGEIGIDAKDVEGVTVKGKYLMYNGKPLVRNEKVIVYGDMTDDYILFLGIMTTKPVDTENGKVEVPDNIMVQILSTDTSMPPAQRMVKQAIKNGLFDAMEVGLTWLKRYNEGKA